MDGSTEMKWLAPARVVVAKFGIGKLNGAKVVAEIAGVHVTRVYRWMRAKEAGGTGGLIPSRYHSCLLNGARDRGVTLTAEELIGAASAVKAQ